MSRKRRHGKPNEGAAVPAAPEFHEYCEPREVTFATPLKSTAGLQPHEITALALVMANDDSCDSPSDGVSIYSVRQGMELAGFNNLASRLALARLCRMGMVEPFEASERGGYKFAAYRMTPVGEDWLLDNQDVLELRLPARRTELFDDDVPF